MPRSTCRTRRSRRFAHRPKEGIRTVATSLGPSSSGVAPRSVVAGRPDHGIHSGKARAVRPPQRQTGEPA
eukprot:12390335-Alexandrium_andersonii.AAC.1